MTRSLDADLGLCKTPLSNDVEYLQWRFSGNSDDYRDQPVLQSLGPRFSYSPSSRALAAPFYLNRLDLSR